MIVVAIVARAAAAPSARFAAAYSTCDVGNSGWRWFEAGPKSNIYRLDYNVPVMDKGNEDFVGQPAIDVFSIGIAIL